MQLGVGQMMQILQPPGWVRPRGYSNGVAARSTLVFTAGQLGWDEQGNFQTTEFVGQVRQALKNIVTILEQAGAQPENIVRLTWYVTDKEAYLLSLKEVGSIFRELIGSYNATGQPGQTPCEIESITADGAYDGVPTYQKVVRHGKEAAWLAKGPTMAAGCSQKSP